MTLSNCRSCGAPIKWARTENGKMMPLDAEPTPNGNVIITSNGVAWVIAKGNESFFDDFGQKFMPHHATCPQAKLWRKKP